MKAIADTPLQTAAELRAAMSIKLKLTKLGYEATVKADDPIEAVQRCRRAHVLLLRLKERYAAPAASTADDFPVLILSDDGYLTMQSGGGFAAVYNPDVQTISEDYRVKVDLTLNSRGVGWEITVKAVSAEWGVALIGYTERLLQQAFAQNG